MIFETNPGFIFHDSPGFEAGDDQELKLVQKFIAQSSRARNVNRQLHAIWYVSTCPLENKWKSCFGQGTASQQVMTDQSLQQRGSFSMNVEQDLVFVVLSIYHHGFMTLFHKVPVIVLWTKTDSLDLDRVDQLMKEGNNLAEAMEQAPKKAWDDFEKKIYPIFNTFKYRPKAYVAFRSEHYNYSYLAIVG